MKNVLLINDFYLGGGAETVFREHIDLLRKSKGFTLREYVGSSKHSKPKNVLSYLFSISHFLRLGLQVERCSGYNRGGDRFWIDNHEWNK